ncbi:MAG: hypothetical protein E4H23_05845, partial [Chrysiogenales bacterium]
MSLVLALWITSPFFFQYQIQGGSGRHGRGADVFQGGFQLDRVHGKLDLQVTQQGADQGGGQGGYRHVRTIELCDLLFPAGGVFDFFLLRRQCQGCGNEKSKESAGQIHFDHWSLLSIAIHYILKCKLLSPIRKILTFFRRA